ncbi:MAG: hypothetical protein WBN96_04420 [Gammaproteobacteria bacterium]
MAILCVGYIPTSMIQVNKITSDWFYSIVTWRGLCLSLAMSVHVFRSAKRLAAWWRSTCKQLMNGAYPE